MNFYTIEELNLEEEKLKIISNAMGVTLEELLHEDDFHVATSKEELVKWLYEDSENELIDKLLNGKTVDEILKDYSNIFCINERTYLFIYE